MEKAYDRAKKILTDNRNQLVAIAEGLLEYETLTGAELRELLDTGKIDRTAAEKDKKAKAKTRVKSSVPTTGESAEAESDDKGFGDPEPQPES